MDPAAPKDAGAQSGAPLEPPQSRFWNHAYTRYLFVLGLAVYFAAVWYLGWRDVRDELLGARKWLIAATFGLIFGAAWVRSFKWRYALGPDHSAYSLFFLSKVTANWSPARLGEFSPMILRRHRTPRVGAWIMLDRLLEVVTTLALGFAGLAFIQLIPPQAYGAALMLAAGAVAAGAYALTRRRFFLAIAARTREGSIVHRFAMLFAAISEEVFEFAAKLPVTIAVTVATKCADLFAIVLLFVAFGHDPGFWLVATAKCALAIVSFLPITPVATGIPHLTQAKIMSDAAGIPYDTLAAAIGVEVVIVNVALLSSFGLVAPGVRGELKHGIR